MSHALLLLPFTLLGTTPLAAANLGVLLTTLLSGWGMYLLVAWLTGDRRAGLVAGVFYAVCAFGPRIFEGSGGAVGFQHNFSTIALFTKKALRKIS